MGAEEQLSLFGRSSAGPLEVVSDAESVDFSALRRTVCDESSWLDYASSFLRGHESLFDQLRSTLPWKSESRVMYDRRVEIPRLFCSLPEDAEIPPMLAHVQKQLATHYAVPGFDHIGVALYRDGSDSVAWHRDHVPKDRNTIVAILSLGQPRRLLVRRHRSAPSGGPANKGARAFQLGWGDLLVMGGMFQANWEHGLPKQRQAAPRMSCVFRHVFD